MNQSVQKVTLLVACKEVVFQSRINNEFLLKLKLSFDISISLKTAEISIIKSDTLSIDGRVDLITHIDHGDIQDVCEP